MAGLIDSRDGLEYGVGLTFMRGLGGPGLVNPGYSGQIQNGSASFAGAGNLSARAALRLNASALLSGAGNVSSDGTVVT